MGERVNLCGLDVARELQAFVDDEVLPGTGVDTNRFWQALADIVGDLAPRNRALVARREELQQKIDAWHGEHAFDLEPYQAFLRDIGYLVPEGEPFTIGTTNVDPEIAEIAGPQLVVPVSNARYALNAANARWGSLYDAFYGTDAIEESGGATRGEHYNPVRGHKVVARAKAVLEVRSLDIPFIVEDGQIVGRLVYDRLTEVPETLYGQGIGSHYQAQGLKLSKHFRQS